MSIVINSNKIILTMDQTPEPNSAVRDNNDHASRTNVEIINNEPVDYSFYSYKELKKWLQLGIVYSTSFLILIFWQSNYPVIIQVAIVPPILFNLKNIILSFFLLKKCEK